MAKAQILIVEDDNIVVMELRDRLQRLGYAVPAVASYGEEAIEKAAEMRPDLVLMDIRLKGDIDGIEAAEEIRARFDIPVIYLTALADENTLQRAKVTEPYGYIIKPFEERELHTTIEMALYRHKVERKLKESEQWLATTLKSIGDAVIATDEKGLVTFMNPVAEALTGWKQEDALGKNVVEVFHIASQEARQVAENLAAKVVQEGIVFDLTNHILIAKGGTEIPIDDSAAPIRDDRGDIIGAVLVFRDITERKQAEEALKASQEYIRNIIDSSLDMIIAVDMDRHIVEFNKAAEETFGYRREEVLGVHVDILYADPEEGLRVHRETIEKGQCVREILDRRKNGEVFPCLLSASVLRDRRGELVGVMGVSRDITERKRAEETLKRRVEQLTSLNRASQAVTASLELDQVLAEIVSLASEVVASDYASVVLVDEEGRLVRGAEYLPGVLAIERRIRAEGFTHWIVRSRQAVVVDDIDEDGTVNPKLGNGAQSPDGSTGSPQRPVEGPRTANPLVVEAGVKSFVGLPLVTKDRLLGVLYLYSLRPGNFRDQLPLLTTFANQVAIAIENARLYQAERKRAVQLAVVNQVARQAASILDLDQSLQEIVTAIQQGFDYHNVALFLLNEATSELEMRAIAGGFVDVAAPDYCQAVGVGMIGWTAETGQPLLANDVSQEPRYIPGFLEGPLNKSELCVPLKLIGQVIGVLDVQDTQLNAFDETDLLAMETLADQIAVTIENARLFEETKRRFKETTALYETSLDITAQLGMTELLKSIVERAVVLLWAEAGGIYLYDPEREELRLAIGYDYTEKYVGTTLKSGEGMAGKVFQTGEPLIVDDYRTWEGRAPMYEADQPFTAALEVPLKWQDRIIGVLAINADVQERTFNQDDVWLATLFANQAAVAIENARIYEKERKRVTQLELIGGITQRIASILDLNELLPQVAHLIGDTFGYYHTNIFLVEADSDELILRASAGPLGETLIDRLRLKIGREGITGWVAHSGDPLLVNDVNSEPRYHFAEESKDARSELAVPIKLKGEIIGVLDVQSVKPDAFDEDDVSILQTLADQLAVAIENARLYEREKRQKDRLAWLSEITHFINARLDLRIVLAEVVEAAALILETKYSTLFLLDAESKVLIPCVSYGHDWERLKEIRFALGEGLAGWVAETGQSLNVTDTAADPRFVKIPPDFDQFASMVLVPLIHEGRVIGVLTAERKEGGAFSEEDELLLATLADQATVAIENAQLYEAEAQRRQEAETLRQTAVALTSTLDLGEALDRILEQLHRVVAYDSASVQLLREDHLEIVGGRGFADPSAVIGLRFPVPGDNPNTRVIESGEPVILADAQVAHAPFREPPHDHIRSWLGVPMRFREQAIGVITLDSTELGHFTTDHARLAAAFANQAAMAIENARLFEAEAQRRREAETLRQAAMAFTSTLDPTDVLSHIAEQMGQAIDATSAYICSVEPGAGTSTVLAEYLSPHACEQEKVSDLGVTYVETDRRFLESLLTGESYVEHVDAPDLDEDDRDHYTQYGAQSILYVPLYTRGQVIGYVELWESRQRREFTPEEIALCQGIAQQAASALENVQLYEQITALAAELEVHVQERTAELTRKAREISFLYQASVALSSSLEVEEVLKTLAQQAALAVDALGCTICELQDDVLVVMASYRDPALPWKDSGIGRPYLLADYPATREAIEKGQPLRVRVDDPLADEAVRAELQELGYTALLQVHIVSRNQVVGIVEVFDNKPEREFSEGDAALLQTIANQAGMAIEKAYLFQQTCEESNRLALLYDISRKLSVSLDPEQALRDIFQISVASTGASKGSVIVFDDENRASYRILMRDLSPAEANDVIGQVLRKGLAGWVFEHKQPAIIFDISQDERWLRFPDDPEPVGSAMAIPFIERDRVRGLLTLVHPQPHHFNQIHLDLLSSIANQVAGVIERARLYGETRRRAQEVAQQKEQTDAIVRSMADGLIVTDLGNRLVLANPAAEELLEFRLEDAIGQEIETIIRDDRLRQIVHDTLDKQQAGYEVDIELTDSYDGTQRIMRARTAVVNDSSGQPLGIVTNLRDVTHEREVQRLKDELVSTISHELRTPMSSVLGFSELLLARQLSEEKRQLYIQTIHKEAQRLSDLINDFLDIQRMRRGQLEYYFEEVNLGELTREAVAIYSGQSDAHTLTMDLPPDLPLVQADPNRLKQVFGNLLSNAIKFSPGGGTVAVSVQAEDDEIYVAVSDQGIGIPAEAMPHLFERFFRVDSSDRRAIKGTGLGLAICKEIVEAHGGRIWAESQKGVGTTVAFSLPMMAKRRILVIDDEQDIREMFQRLLSERSCEVLTAANGQEGLSLMEEELPDLVILDIAMPVMNGYQFLEIMKEDRRMEDIPVIAISGVDTDIDRLKELEADEFLSKPFSNTVLLDTVQRLLERS